MVLASWLNKRLFGLSVGVLLTFLPCWADAQDPMTEYTDLKRRFPDETFVLTNYQVRIVFALDKKGELKVSMENTEEGMCMTDNISSYMENSIHTSGFMTATTVEAATLIPNGSKYKTNKVTEFVSHDFANDAVFFDDSKAIKYVYTGLQKGAKTREHVVYDITDPHFAPSLYASSFRPIAKGQLQLVVGKGVEVELTPYNLDTLHATYTKVEKDGEVTHTWQFDNFKGFDYEADAPTFRRFTPHIMLRVKRYQSAQGEVVVLDSINDLHAWYCEFLAKCRIDVDPELKALVDSLCAGAQTQEEAAKRMYRWVQQNIKYVAIEDGYNGYQPQFANKVYTSRFGDCKGMSNLLHNMYEIYGLNSGLTWIGTRDLCYSYDELPTPSVDNHMIVTLDLDGERRFLDPTHSELSFYAPSPFIQGKQAMINRNCEGFELAYVPVMSADRNAIDDTVKARIQGNTLYGEGKATLHGYARLTFQQSQYRSDYEFLRDFCREFLQKGSNKFVLDTVWLERVDDVDKPLEIHYAFRIEDYLISSNGERFVNLNLDFARPPQSVEKDRKFPMEERYQTQYNSFVDLQLEAPLQVDEVPESNQIGNDAFHYRVDYQLGEGHVRRASTTTYNFLELSPADFNDWNSFVRNFSSIQRKSLIIKSNE